MPKKAETDPITPDEWLLRIVHFDKLNSDRVPQVSLTAFEPRVKGDHPDTDGISLFRKDCLRDPSDVLLVVAEDKRPLKGVVQLPAALLASLQWTVLPKRDVTVAGHVVVPELNSAAYVRDRASFRPFVLQLAVEASKDENILVRPTIDEAS